MQAELEKILTRIKRILTITALVMVGLLLFIFLWHFAINSEDDLNELLSNIIQFAGIFSAILITFLISKVFQIRQEKISILKEAQFFSNKVTDFRRIAKHLIDSYGFWHQEMRRHVDANFSELNKFDLRNYELPNNHPIEILKEEYRRQQDVYNPNFLGVELYMDLKSLVLDGDRLEGKLYDSYDWYIVYPSDLVEEWINCNSGDYWYFLDYKWHEYKDHFNFQNVTKDRRELILKLACKIDQEFSGRSFDNKLLGDLGSDFTQYYFPMLYKYTSMLEQKLPQAIKAILNVLYSTILFGIIFPVLISSLHFSDLQLKLAFVYLCVVILCCTFIYLMFKFKKLLENVLNVFKLSS